MLIRKLFKAEMAHNVPGAYTKRCHYLHGHSYKFELFLRSNTPNPSGMVADFKGIKEMGINDFFDSFDHTVVVCESDPVAKIVSQVNPERHIIVPFIPTAEMLAKACFEVCHAIMETGPKLSQEVDAIIDHVIVHETATGYGVYGLDDVSLDKFPPILFEKWKISEGIIKDWKQSGWVKKVLEHRATSSLSS